MSAEPAPLWRAAEHEPLAAEPWDERRARDAIAAIVADTEAAYDGDRWPWHPLDDEDDVPRSVYAGGAGIAWALHDLGAGGWGDAVLHQLDRYRAVPDAAEHARAESYWIGECGIALAGFRLRGDPALADRVHELVLANLDAPSNEVMSGAPGSLLAAEAMLAWTGEPRWDEAWRRLADAVLAARDDDGLWTQDLFGRPVRALGPAHGAAGNIRALANRGVDAGVEPLEAHALRDGPLVNWAPSLESPPDRIRVQWCHGAPGVVSALGGLLDEGLARAGAELTWQAGPLAKGPGLCHGTAGNGYAFLALHARTGEAVWLDRARAFALHAIAQVDAFRTRYGRGRYSLFTGDVGVALYLRDCLAGRGDFPTTGPFA